MNRKKLLETCLLGLTIFEDRFDLVRAEDVTWICERLGWHKVLPMAAALSDSRKSKCDQLERCFKHVILENTIREKHYEKQVKKIFRTFKNHDVGFIPYKGPFWCQPMYPDFSWRHIGDIDLMMDVNHARKASALLQEMGYIPDIMEKSENEDFALRGELTLFPNPKAKNEFPVQLHWNPLPSPRFLNKQFMPAEFFKYGSSPSVWKGIEFSVPLPEIQFFYYILHATCQHQFLRFAHIIAPIHLMIKSSTMDWNLIHDLTVRQRVQTPMYYGLKFINVFSSLSEQAQHFIIRLRPGIKSRLAAAFLKPTDIALATRNRCRWRRELFRVAMSW